MDVKIMMFICFTITAWHFLKWLGNFGKNRKSNRVVTIIHKRG